MVPTSTSSDELPTKRDVASESCYESDADMDLLDHAGFHKLVCDEIKKLEMMELTFSSDSDLDEQNSYVPHGQAVEEEKVVAPDLNENQESFIGEKTLEDRVVTSDLEDDIEQSFTKEGCDESCLNDRTLELEAAQSDISEKDVGGEGYGEHYLTGDCLDSELQHRFEKLDKNDVARSCVYTDVQNPAGLTNVDIVSFFIVFTFRGTL
jgi:hypothetical protein